MRRLEIVLVTFVIAVGLGFVPIYYSFVTAIYRELGPQPWPKPPLAAAPVSFSVSLCLCGYLTNYASPA